MISEESVKITANQRAAIEEIVKLFDDAEHHVKEIEHFADQLTIPSINELRYVGYHLACALTCSDAAELDDQVRKARGHCKRAIYDAHELGIIFCLEQIKGFQQRYQGNAHIVSNIISNYSDCLTKAKACSRYLAEANKNGRHDRDSYYDKCRPEFEKMREICDKFDEIGPEVDAEINRQNQESQVQARRFKVQMMFTILALVVSVTIGGTIISLNLADGSPQTCEQLQIP